MTKVNVGRGNPVTVISESDAFIIRLMRTRTISCVLLASIPGGLDILFVNYAYMRVVSRLFSRTWGDSEK